MGMARFEGGEEMHWEMWSWSVNAQCQEYDFSDLGMKDCDRK